MSNDLNFILGGGRELGDPMPKSKCKGGGGLVEQTQKVLKDKPPPLHLRPPAWGRRVVGGLRLEPRLPKAPRVAT